MTDVKAGDPGGQKRGITRAALAFLHHEAAGGVLLIIAAAIALVLDNSRLSPFYDGLLETPVSVKIGGVGLDKPLLLWINDGLMAIFFCLVGLEIKRELMVGELSTREQALLPAIAALGGMAVPAAIYVAINAGSGNAATLKGWAIPSATDIAFAVGVLSLLGPRVPASVKVFLLALAIIDDLGAIVIIALFYTANLSVAALLLAAAGIAVLLVLNRRGVGSVAPYVLAGAFIWVCVLKSGVHATLAGVIVGLSVPMQARSGGAVVQPLARLQESLHPWVAFAILPIFGFANAGVSLAGVSVAALLEPIPLGIALGLFVGKQIGIFATTWLAVKSGLCRALDGATWVQVWGVSVLGGIGFTMSLFIGTLAFPEPEHAAAIRIGVLAGSLASAIVGWLVLRATLRGPPVSAGRADS